MGKRAKVPWSKLNAKSKTSTARQTHFPDPPKGTVFNPDVNPEFKDQCLSVYGHRLMSNRDLRVVEVCQLLMDWASDDNQPNGLREGFPINSAVGINLVIDDFEAVSRRYNEDSEDAFTIFAHEWRWRPPVLGSFKPMEVGRWELEVYDILYNYCLRPLEFNSLTMNQFIAWLCSNGSVPQSFRTRVEKVCLSRGGIKYSEFLEIIIAYVDAQPEEVKRKERLSKFFADNEPPRLKAIGLKEFDQYKRDVIKIAQANRDILLLWDEHFVHWLRRGFDEFPTFDALIKRRALELAIRLDETRPPSCKAINLLFGDLLIVMEDYISKEHDRNAVEQKVQSLQSQLNIEHQQPQASSEVKRTEVKPQLRLERSDHGVELEDILNEILHNEKEIHHQRAQIHSNRAEVRGTIDDDEQMLMLEKKELKSVMMLEELRQAQGRRKMKSEQAMPQGIRSEVIEIEKPTPQVVVAQGTLAQKIALREVVPPRKHYTYISGSKTFYPHALDKSVQVNLDPDYERQQRCRMAEIRRQRLTGRTTKTR